MSRGARRIALWAVALGSWRERDLLTAPARRALVESEDRITAARGRADPVEAMRALEDLAYGR